MLFRIILVVLFSSCTKQSVENMNSRDGLPDQESWGVNIILTDQGIIRAKVESGHLEKYNAKEFILLNNDVKVDFFDANENHTSVLTSQQAEVDQKSNDMKAFGNVVVVSDSGITLYSETLSWKSKDEKLQTKEEIMTRLIPLGLDGNMDEINALEDRVLRGKIKAAIVRAKRDKK